MMKRPKIFRVVWKFLGVSCALMIFTMGYFRSENDKLIYEQKESVKVRHLLTLSWNCTPAAIEQFPKPLISPELRRQGALVVHLLISAYMFIALAIVCEDYFVPSLELICQGMNLQPDVAGATFMAAGSSAPELATALIAVFIAKDDIGLGAVVGSAVFNIMFVIGLCAICAGMVVYLKWWPLLRDCLFYLISIGLLLFTIYDSKVEWYEAAAMLIIYFVYCIVMYFNPILEKKVGELKCHCFPTTPELERTHLVSYNKMDEAGVLDTEVEKSGSAGYKTPDDSSAKLEDDVSALEFPKGAFRRMYWCICLPLNLACYVTIPDCRRPRWRKWFVITFIMSMVWISFTSYLMVWMITIIGFTMGIPDTVMGLTFLAAGVSVPDAITSLIVVREGLGDMAVSNAIGSNVFDILLCLGLPWFLQTVIIEPGSVILVISKGLTYSTISLLSTVLFLVSAVHLNGWKLDKRLGVMLLIWYFLFMILASLYELNVFGMFNPPECPSDY